MRIDYTQTAVIERFFRSIFIIYERIYIMSEEKKGFVAEFKEFIAQGNVLDMAVGIIIGTAFTAIVTSLVNDILMPIVGYAIGGISFDSFAVTLPAIAGGEPAVIGYGLFIQNIIYFLFTALAVFCIVKAVNKAKSSAKKKEAEAPAEEAPAEPSDEVKALNEIIELLKAQNEK